MNKKLFSTIITLTILSSCQLVYAAQDAKDIVTSDGVYNSITVDSTQGGTRQHDFIYGISSPTSGNLLDITMSGAQTIRVIDMGMDAQNVKSAFAIGVSGGDIKLNGGTLLLNVLANGGKANDFDYAANAEASGLYQKNNITGNAYITISAIGGIVANSVWDSQANATANGMYNYINSSMSGNAYINITAIGGFANSTGNSSVSTNADANAIGIKVSNDINSISGNVYIDITAMGGTANDSGFASAGAYAYGLYTSSSGQNTIAGNVYINIDAIGGTAERHKTSVVNARAYGVSAGGGTNLIEGNAYITLKATGGMANESVNIESEAISCGLYVYNSNNTINGDVYIDVQAQAASGQEFRAYSLFARTSNGVSSTNDLSSTGKRKQINGDVFSEGDPTVSNKLLLDTPESYLQGNIISASGATNKIKVANGATWRPVYDNRYGTYWQRDNAATHSPSYAVTANSVAEITLQDGAKVDLAWDGWRGGIYTARSEYRTMSIDKLNGNSDIVLRVDTDIANNKADKFDITNSTIATANNSGKIVVNYDASFANLAAGDTVSGAGIVLTGDTTNMDFVGVSNEYNELAFSPTVEKVGNNWQVSSIKTGASSNLMTAADARLVMNKLWLATTNDLSKRLGELHEGESGEQLDGIWAKYNNATIKNGSGRRAELSYNSFQIGYDKMQQINAGKIYRGVTISHLNGSSKLETGSGKANSTMLGLYQTGISDSGHYYDIIFKTGRMAGDYGMTDLAGNYSKADYSSWGTSISGEYGYRHKFRNGMYIQPQAELIFGHMNGYNYTTSRGMHVNADSSKHAITRLGLAVGKQFERGSMYIKADYFHDFAGSGGVTVGRSAYSRNDRLRDWFAVGIGGHIVTGKNSNIYLAVDKYLGELKSDINFQVGARWSW